MNKTCLSYWFPKLLDGGLPVPKTEIVKTNVDLVSLFDGEDPEGWPAFLEEMKGAVRKIGLPCFLRTGQSSGKHRWKHTCHLTDVDLLPWHIASLVEWSHVVDFFGLAHDVWVVRELLPTKPLCVLPAYGDFPLVPEARCFVSDGKVSCWHPYWPEQAIREGFPYAPMEPGSQLVDEEAWEARRELPDNFAEIVRSAHDLPANEFLPLAQRVADVFKGDGAWSVDLLPTERGWFVTDMAEAKKSFHWEGCEMALDRVEGK